MRHLRGRNAIVTGASYGIGPRIARALAAQGVNLVLAARSGARLERVAAELAGAGVRVVPVAADLRDPAARERLVSRAEAELGPVDILVSNASTAYGGRLHTTEPAQVDAIVETNSTCLSMALRSMPWSASTTASRRSCAGRASTAPRSAPASCGARGCGARFEQNVHPAFAGQAG